MSTLTIIYAINIADRFVLSTLLEPIKADFHLSDSALGFLTGVSLAIFYVTAGLPLGVLADRANRKKMVAISVGIWSVMTILCGLSVTYWMMLFMRIGVGIGEAGATPPSHSLLSDKFGPRSRAFALSVFGLGASVGAYLGASGAGYLNDHYGWRQALIIFGVAGLPFAALCWLIREPKRGQDDAGSNNRREGATLRDTIGFMLADRALVHIMAGATIVTFWGWGILWWTPAFLTRSFALTTGQAGSLLGPMHGIGGGIVMLLTIAIMAWLKRGPQWWVPSFVAWTTMIGAVPSMALFLVSDIRVATAMLWIFVPVIYIYIGPTSALVQNRFPPEMRAKGCAILLFVANIANLAIAPQLIGALSDVVGAHVAQPSESLRYVLLGCSFTGIWAAYHYWMAARAMKDLGQTVDSEQPSLRNLA
ncbi:MFS transporter [Dyella halodurans]|uniref:Spinster family MFS transporter n=1 Tax=Dyella halodurans TaxID=1920171 RepID=A0ABV9C064_9GAMM|nr:MFS transporter [Dyella halodurans]